MSEQRDMISRAAAHEMVRGLTSRRVYAGYKKDSTTTGLTYDDVQFGLDKLPAVDAIPVDWLMRYAQLPTEFAISEWRKPEREAKEALKKQAKEFDKPMTFDDALRLVDDSAAE